MDKNINKAVFLMAAAIAERSVIVEAMRKNTFGLCWREFVPSSKALMAEQAIKAACQRGE